MDRDFVAFPWGLPLEIKNPFRSCFAVFDCEENLADRLLIKKHIPTVVTGVLQHNKTPYTIKFMRVAKRNALAFVDALSELPDTMLICGYTEYASVVNEVLIHCSDVTQKEKHGKTQAEPESA